MTKITPKLSDLYDLAGQLARDNDASVQDLKARDHKIGRACDTQNECARLLFWLRAVSAGVNGADQHQDSWLTEATAALVGRLLALFFGFSAMMSLLLTSGQGLVNVFVFVLIFVFAQFVMSVFSTWTMYKMAKGNTATILPINPAKLLLSRIYPDKRYFREVQSVLRIAFLRYGQEMGALFTVGAMTGFMVVLAMSDFTFVWGSTFQLSTDFVSSATDFLSLPWSSLLPEATVDPQVIVDSRYHPALTELSRADIERMRGWWPFLFMSLVCYALLPRVLLWIASRFYFSKCIAAAFTAYPGTDLVLSRMKSPMVETRGEVVSGTAASPGGGERWPLARPDARLFLVNWAQALGADEIQNFEELAAVPAANIVCAGIGSLARDMEQAKKASNGAIDRLLVVVRSWEPPLAELADFLAQFSHVSRCTLYALALPGRPVTEEKLEDWRIFSRTLPFSVVDVLALEDL